MAIRAVRQAELIKVRMTLSSKAFNPSGPVSDRDLFAGRERQLTGVLGAVGQSGQHAILFGAFGLARRARRRYWRALASEVAVTVQEFSTTTSAWAADLTTVNPASRNWRASTWLSAWFNLHPWVWIATVGPFTAF